MKTDDQLLDEYWNKRRIDWCPDCFFCSSFCICGCHEMEFIQTGKVDQHILEAKLYVKQNGRKVSHGN